MSESFSESFNEYLLSSPFVRLSELDKNQKAKPLRLEAIHVAPSLIASWQVVDIVLPPSVSIRPENNSYAYVLTDGRPGFLLDLKTGEQYTAGLPSTAVTKAVIRPGDKLDEIALLAPSHESIYFWSAKEGKITRRLPGRDITSIAYSDTGAYLVAGSAANRVFVYSTNWRPDGDDDLLSMHLSVSVRDVVWHSTGANNIKGRFYVLTADGYFSLIAINNGKLVRRRLSMRPGDGENRWNDYSLHARSSMGTIQIAIKGNRNLVAMESEHHENQPVLVHIDREESGKVQKLEWTNSSGYLSVMCQRDVHFLEILTGGVYSRSLDRKLPDGFTPVTCYTTDHTAVVVGY